MNNQKSKKYRIIYTASLVLLLSGSCEWGNSKHSIKNRPEICVQVFDEPRGLDKLNFFSVEQLLIIQKCGLEYHPQYQIHKYIADHDDYPVPELIKNLQKDEEDEYYLHLILNFVALTESKKHNKKLLSDRDLILKEIDKVIQKIKNRNLKKYSEIEFNKIKYYFNNN